MDEQLMRDADEWLDKQLHDQQTKMTALRKAKRTLSRGLGPVWHIQIVSVWMGGDFSDPEKDISDNYKFASLRSAIRAAATDFCVLNRRSYPGHVYFGISTKHVSKSWDVQGSWYISLVLAPGVHMGIPQEMYQNHIRELKEETDEIFGPEAKNIEKRKLPTIP